VGTALGYFVSSWWLLLPIFVGLNLIQSAITKWCLLENILKKLALRGYEWVICGHLDRAVVERPL